MYNFKLYNSDRKNRFLNEEYPNEQTRTTYASLLVGVAKFEEEKEKDVCDFSLSESIELLIGLKKKTFKSLDVAQTIIIKYVDWCIDHGYSKTFLNTFKLIDKEDLKKYTHRIAVRHSYFTRDRLYFEVIDRLHNYVDKALVILLFEGVRGRSDIDHTFEELRNLKYTDIHPETNTITVTRDDGTDREIQVEERTMKILVAAWNEETYYKANGEGTGYFAIRPLKQTPYLLRTMEVEFSEGEKITSSAIGLRFRNFRKYTGVRFLNPTIIFQSGLLEICEDIEKRNGKITNDDYRDIYRNLNLDDRRWFSLKEMHETFKENKAPR